MGKQSRIQFTLTRETRKQSRKPSTMTGHVKTLVGWIGQTPRVLKEQKYYLCFAHPRLERQVEWCERLEWQLCDRIGHWARKSGIRWKVQKTNKQTNNNNKKTRDWISRWFLAKLRQYFCPFNTLGVCPTLTTSVLTFPVIRKAQERLVVEMKLRETFRF